MYNIFFVEKFERNNKKIFLIHKCVCANYSNLNLNYVKQYQKTKQIYNKNYYQNYSQFFDKQSQKYSK